MATWRSGYAAACKAVYTGSIPVVAFRFGVFAEEYAGSCRKSAAMVLTVLLAAIVGVCLTLAIVGWVARRLGLPIQETLAWFGLTEHPLLPEQ